MPVISYNTYTLYINMALKKYPYLFLYNSDRYNNAYKFKNLDLYFGCGKKYTEEK